jgi:hypothetical protein
MSQENSLQARNNPLLKRVDSSCFIQKQPAQNCGQTKKNTFELKGKVDNPALNRVGSQLELRLRVSSARDDNGSLERPAKTQDNV